MRPARPARGDQSHAMSSSAGRLRRADTRHRSLKGPLKGHSTGPSRGRPVSFGLRTAEPSDAPQLHALIQANLEEGHLLPRTLDELVRHAPRFTIAVRRRRIQGEGAPGLIVGCAELAPLSPSVAEVRSLAVDRSARGSGIGRRIVEELRRRARREGFERLCAFTHRPEYFIQMSFSIVPHSWFPEKIFTDCVKCPLFRRCGQYAMVVPLEAARDEPAEPAQIGQL
jgi:amino-acid N-acetyltransferase